MIILQVFLIIFEWLKDKKVDVAFWSEICFAKFDKRRGDLGEPIAAQADQIVRRAFVYDKVKFNNGTGPICASVKNIRYPFLGKRRSIVHVKGLFCRLYNLQ